MYPYRDFEEFDMEIEHPGLFLIIVLIGIILEMGLMYYYL
tara:strand:- start:305 stop:424 length:120 start_codon:yes stop_codon:yes gene_type:complete